MVQCPLECMSRDLLCESPAGFLEKNATFFLTLVGLVGTGCGVLISYFLKSRCEEIHCLGLFCKRKPIELSAIDVHELKK